MNQSLEDCQARAYISPMIARCLFLAGSLLMPWLPCVSAQLPKRLEKCLPYPTLAQEIRERKPAPAQVKVHVVRVEFDPDDMSMTRNAKEKTVASLFDFRTCHSNSN